MYRGDLDALVRELRKLNPNIRSGCMNGELPAPFAYESCNGQYGNSGVPGVRMTDQNPLKALNEYVLVTTVDSRERKWLGHTFVNSLDMADDVLDVYQNAPSSAAIGFVIHPASEHPIRGPTQEWDALQRLLEHLHRRDPTGERSFTLDEIVRLGLLAERELAN